MTTTTTQALTMTGQTRLADIPNDWLAGQLSASSLRVYRLSVRDYQAFCTGRSLDPLSPGSLAAWRDELVAQTSKSPNTINRELAAVRRFVKEGAAPSRGLWPAELAVLFANVPGARTLPLKGRLKPHARIRIEPRDLRALCELPDRSTLIGARDAALLATFASSGVRNAELASLTCWQIEARDGGYFLAIVGKKDITPRYAYLSEEAYRLIQEWLAMRFAAGIESQYVFTGFVTEHLFPRTEPITTKSVWRIVSDYAKRYAAETGNEVLAHVKPHDLRRFLVTQLAEREGVDVAAEAAGHKNIQTTVQGYVLRNRRGGLTNHLY